jgi:hypothetical protein
LRGGLFLLAFVFVMVLILVVGMGLTFADILDRLERVLRAVQ